jgi:8-oxo-dGTP pyrophosphatase MutT (NUDIX family)
MVQEFSFGIVPLQKKNGTWQVFLVQHLHGHWGLPKGRTEAKESPLETAKRELFEETSLTVRTLLFEEPIVEHYQFKRLNVPIEKTVGYFLAEVEGEEKILLQELQNSRWVLLQEAADYVTFDQIKNVLRKAYSLVSHRSA